MCLIQRRQASRQAQFIPKIHECWEQILGTQTFLSWWWIWIIQFGSQKWVIFHLQCIFWRWKYAGRYFPGAVNICTVQSKCTLHVQIQEIQRDPKFITRWLWVNQEIMCCLEHRPACFLRHCPEQLRKAWRICLQSQWLPPASKVWYTTKGHQEWCFWQKVHPTAVVERKCTFYSGMSILRSATLVPASSHTTEQQV